MTAFIARLFNLLFVRRLSDEQIASIVDAQLGFTDLGIPYI